MENITEDLVNLYSFTKLSGVSSYEFLKKAKLLLEDDTYLQVKNIILNSCNAYSFSWLDLNYELKNIIIEEFDYTQSSDYDSAPFCPIKTKSSKDGMELLLKIFTGVDYIICQN